MATVQTVDFSGLRQLLVQELSMRKCCSGWEWTSGVMLELLGYIAEGQAEGDDQQMSMRMLHLYASIFSQSMSTPSVRAFKSILSMFYEDMSLNQRERIEELGFNL